VIYNVNNGTIFGVENLSSPSPMNYSAADYMKVYEVALDNSQQEDVNSVPFAFTLVYSVFFTTPFQVGESALRQDAVLKQFIATPLLFLFITMHSASVEVKAPSPRKIETSRRPCSFPVIEYISASPN
jgi:hypothetical protein